MTFNLTPDIKPQWSEAIAGWLNVVRRLQSISRRHEGHAILSIQVVVNNLGVPVIWSEPKLTKLEPKSFDCAALLRLLTQDS